MSLNVPLLQSSFQLVMEQEPRVIANFYTILFERYPQAEAMFSNVRPEAQQQMLTETLGKLGERHAEYGVTTEMYGWVGECLLAALADAAGDAWSDELADAWGEAYGAIVSLMEAGVAAAAA